MNKRAIGRLLAALTMLAVVPWTVAQTPLGTAFTYQGQLKQNGTPVNNNVQMQFELTDGVNVLASFGPVGVQVTNGLFTTEIDFGQNVFTGQARWLRIWVAGTQLTPDQKLTPAPYALALPGLFTQQTIGTPNLVAGYAGNTVGPNVIGAVIAGGGDAAHPNRVTDHNTTVGGGLANLAGNDDDDPGNATFATVAGGAQNAAMGDGSTVAGGAWNTAWGLRSTVGGGNGNRAYAEYSTIPGGLGNEIGSSGWYSLAAGLRAKPNHPGTFVWGDSTTPQGSFFESTGNDQFLVKATGGVGIGTNVPDPGSLTVSGPIRSLTGGFQFPDGTVQLTSATGAGVFYPDSMAELRAVTPLGAPARAFLAGYWAPGDGGGGQFFWDGTSTTSDNGGTIIAPDDNPPAGRWKRLIDGCPFISVKWFGAKGDRDPNSPDTLAVTNALRAAIATGVTDVEGNPTPGAEVFFPPGAYLLTETINVATLVDPPNPPRGVSLVGHSHQTSILLFDVPSGVDALDYSFNPGGYEPDSYGTFRIANLTVAGNNGFDSAVRDLLVVHNIGGVLIENCEFRYCARYNLRASHIVYLVVRSSLFQRAGVSNVFIGDPDHPAAVDYTTASFDSCYAQLTRNGPAFDVNCTWASFYSPIAESAGWDDPNDAFGIRVRGGQCNIYSFYGEANGNHDLYIGSHAEATAVIINPWIMNVAGHARTNKTCIYMDRTRGGCILGGYMTNLGPDQRGITFSENSFGCALLGGMSPVGCLGTELPAYRINGEPAPIHDYPGPLAFSYRYGDPPTNRIIATGKVPHAFGGATDFGWPATLTRFSGLSPLAQGDNWIVDVAGGDTVMTELDVGGADFDETAVASFDNPPVSRPFSLYAYVSGQDKVTLVLTNLSGNTIQLNSKVTVTLFAP